MYTSLSLDPESYNTNPSKKHASILPPLLDRPGSGASRASSHANTALCREYIVSTTLKERRKTRPLTTVQAQCDPAAIASVNCTNADQYCHCVRQTGILSKITACADETCLDPSASIYSKSSSVGVMLRCWSWSLTIALLAFTTLFGQVCEAFNISVPVVGSNSSANGTNVSFPSPTAIVTPYTGAASGFTEGVNLGGVVVLVVGGYLLGNLAV